MATEDSEEDILRRAISDDPERAALTRLLSMHFKRLEDYIAPRIPSFLRSTVDAADIRQDTMIEVFRHIRGFEPYGPDAFYAWLETIAKNKLRDAIRTQTRQKRGGGQAAQIDPLDAGTSSVFHPLDGIAGPVETPSRLVSKEELVALVRESTAVLPDRFRQVIEWLDYEGRSVAEVARQLGMKRHAVHMLHYRAKQMLKERLGDSGRYFSKC